MVKTTPSSDGRLLNNPPSPPLWVTPPPTEVPGAWFDQAAVDKVIRQLGALRHSKGKWAGTPLVPDVWQVIWIVAPVFGWKHPDGTRIVRTVWIEVPRKNGKSTISSGFAIVLTVGDGEPGAEVYAAAGSVDQAKVVFEESKRMARTSRALRGKLELLSKIIRYPARDAFFRVLSRIAEVAHGLNVHGGIVDEVHVHKSRDLIDAIMTGTGARRQPLIIFITTADEGKIGSIYDELNGYTIRLAKGLIMDPTFYGVIWAAEETDDPFAEATHRKANPGYGLSLNPAYIRKEAERAASTPTYLATFKRLHLNIRTRSTTRWMQLADWDANGGAVAGGTCCQGPNLECCRSPLSLALPREGGGDRTKPREGRGDSACVGGGMCLRGRVCYGGLDLSSTTDITAWVKLFLADDGLYDIVPTFWLPEDAIPRRQREDGVPYQLWVDQGLIQVTAGNVIDYKAVRQQINADGEIYVVHEIGYDPWNATQLVLQLQDEDGFTMVETRQGYANMSAPTKELIRLMLGRLCRHGGHPVLRWMADNLVLKQDPEGNVRPSKEHSTERIDGLPALIMALDRALRHQGDDASVYEDEGVGLFI